mgnify:FL=1
MSIKRLVPIFIISLTASIGMFASDASRPFGFVAMFSPEQKDWFMVSSLENDLSQKSMLLAARERGIELVQREFENCCIISEADVEAGYIETISSAIAKKQKCPYSGLHSKCEAGKQSYFSVLRENVVVNFF